MYFRGWLHSWTCKDCAYADYYWRLRAFWSGVRGRRDGGLSVPKRCSNADLWFDMWRLGVESAHDELEF